jgi:hypothetical protein
MVARDPSEPPVSGADAVHPDLGDPVRLPVWKPGRFSATRSVDMEDNVGSAEKFVHAAAGPVPAKDLQCPREPGRRPPATGGGHVEAMEMNEADRDGEHQDGEWGEAVTPTPSDPARPGDIVVEPGVARLPEPLVGSDEPTPLDEDEPEGVVPPCPLWAMKDRRHIQWHLLPAHERHNRIRESIGTGDDAIYVIDDGRHHVMVGRRVGARAGECEYCLIGRVTSARYEELRDHTVRPSDAFVGASEITLCGVATAEDVLSSNVFDVARYRDAGEIPARYLPGAPFIAFEKDLEITAD